MHKNKGSRLTIRAIDTDTKNVKSQAPDKAPSKDGSSINQLLGIKGAAQESNKWKIRLQLTKPAGHDFPIVFYLAMARGWITSVIHIFCSSFEVKIKWMDRKLCPRSKLHQFTMLGIAMVNDFKSVEGDRALGLQVNAVTLFLSITVT
ncbi:hypothetical protein HN51_061535 [Arachis hypogaea]